MKRTDLRLKLCVALLAVNLAFIWGNSAMSAELSNVFSDWVKALLDAILPGAAGTGGGTGLLRKLAHFSEFACLGALLCWLAGMLGKQIILPPLLGGFAAACVDETIQFFSPGRNPSPVDVAIDTAGVVVGICLLLAGHYLWILSKRKLRR